MSLIKINTLYNLDINPHLDRVRPDQNHHQSQSSPLPHFSSYQGISISNPSLHICQNLNDRWFIAFNKQAQLNKNFLAKTCACYFIKICMNNP